MIIETMAPPVIVQDQQEEINGIPVDLEMLFSNAKGLYKKGIEKRQRKLFEKIDFIRLFLQEEEKVILVTTGCSPMSSFEQITAGWMVYQLKRAVFVFTDQRVFHVPTKANFSYRSSIACFEYSDCQWIRIRGRSLQVKYQSGKRESFNNIHRRELSKLKQLFKQTLLPEPQEQSFDRGHLCPQCTAPLEHRVYACGHCGQLFKNRRQAQKLSILIPGGGYFYIGQWGFGILDAIAELFLMFQVLGFTLLAVAGQTRLLSGVLWVGSILILEKLISICHVNRFIDEYIPLK